jgi:hypothetical protein
LAVAALAGCFNPVCFDLFTAACLAFAVDGAVTVAGYGSLAVVALAVLLAVVLAVVLEPVFDASLDVPLDVLLGLAVLVFCGAGGDVAGSVVSIAGAGAAKSVAASSAAAILRNM